MIDDARTNDERRDLANRLELEVIRGAAPESAFEAAVALAERDLEKALHDLDAVIESAVLTRRDVYRQLRDLRANHGQPNRRTRRGR